MKRVGASVAAIAAAAIAAWALYAYHTGTPFSRPAASVNAQVARGQAVYEQHCASCHGAKLEGQPNWRARRPDGRLPAPPHDASGHTWHHPEDVLFSIVKIGLVPPLAPPGYQSDMPAYAGVLSDEDIRAVLAFIESRWPAEVISARREMLAGRRP